MTSLHLTGLDGSNPLAFLAALGVLVATDSGDAGAERPRLRWVLDGTWRPVLTSGFDLDALVTQLDADRVLQATEPALLFEYGPEDKRVPDVKPSPDELHQTLQAWVEQTSPSRRTTLDWFTSFVSEGATDGGGSAKPSSLHFTAGQQRFLKAARELQKETTAAHLRAALLGPWSYDAALPVMGWDNTETRDYALRAVNPATEKKAGNPGADWLALRGLQLLPTAARSQRQQTPGVRGGWKNSTFTWPIWTAPATRDEVRALLLMRELVGDALPSTSQLARRGIGQVFRTRILRSDQGGYGSVTPAKPR